VAQNRVEADLIGDPCRPRGRLTDLIPHLPETDKYIKQNSGGEDEALQEILAQRGRQKATRRSEITRAGLVRELREPRWW